MQRGRGGRKPPAGSNKRKDRGRLWAPAWPARASSAPMENAGMAPRRGRTKGLRGRPEREPIQLMTGGKTGSRSHVAGRPPHERCRLDTVLCWVTPQSTNVGCAVSRVVTVFGGTGFLGRRIVRRLRDKVFGAG